MHRVGELTSDLKNHLIRLKNRFESHPPPENRRDRNFFEFVKVETSPVFQLIEEWEEITLFLVKERKLKLLHPQQITSTRENMELLIMHSYFIDARPKRYMEMYRSILYIFDQQLREIEDQSEV